MSSGIYVDSHSTTPVDQRVVEYMVKFMTEEYGNAASIDHVHGNFAQQEVKKARSSIAKIIGAKRDSEVIFTSGATEANNLALIGAYRNYKNKGNHIISTVIEHPCVLETLKFLEEHEGASITLLKVDKYGQINLDDLRNAINEKTILVSVMYANNEIGTINKISEIGAITRENNILFHTDAAQAVGHEKVDVDKHCIDLMSFSGHKFYGPKGIGGLYVRSSSPMVRLKPIIHGGGQEKGFRSGTLNVPGIVGMAKALEYMNSEMQDRKEALREIRDSIYSRLKDEFSDIKLNGHPVDRLTHNLNITIPGVESKALMHALKGKLSFSAGSACSTVKVQPSHVLKAIGLSDNETYQTIRLGLCSNCYAEGVINSLIDAILSVKIN